MLHNKEEYTVEEIKLSQQYIIRKFKPVFFLIYTIYPLILIWFIVNLFVMQNIYAIITESLTQFIILSSFYLSLILLLSISIYLIFHCARYYLATNKNEFDIWGKPNKPFLIREKWIQKEIEYQIQQNPNPSTYLTHQNSRYRTAARKLLI